MTAEEIAGKSTVQEMPKEGDILFADRLFYKHYGVYVGGGNVVHFAANEGKETNAANAYIQKITLKDFCKGAVFHVDKSVPHRYSGEEIVRRALSCVGTRGGEYNLVFNNCEHFAAWCASGEERSRQVEEAAKGVAGAMAAAVAVEIGVGIAKAIKDNDAKERG